jgi:acyl-CoA thioester hydrolase
MLPASETRLRVRYAETDQMGVVYYANYLVWMEVGRVDFCKSRGFQYRDLERDDGIYLAVVESQCRYRYPARYDDEVLVKTTVGDSNSRLISFDYEMSLCESGRILATGSTRHIFVNREIQAVRLPRKYWAAFALSI